MKLLWERALLRQCGEEGERLLLEWDAEGMVEVLLEARIDAFWSQVLLPDAPGNSFPVHHHCIHLQVSPEAAEIKEPLPKVLSSSSCSSSEDDTSLSSQKKKSKKKSRREKHRTGRGINDDDKEIQEGPGVLKEHGYTIKKNLERGDSGREFLVTRKKGDSYVIKEINCRDKKSLHNVQEEFKIWRNLLHAYIVSYLESFEDKEAGVFYIVMEYCEGGDLYERMKTQKEKGIFEEEQILDWMVQICLALQYLHENKVRHRNIQPQNVFLTEHGFVNIEVFGCFEKDSKGLKSDIWSLGCLLHDLCVLDVWPDITCADALSKKENLPHISERYSEELRRLIRQMLSCDPKVRPSAAEILTKPFLTNAVKKNKRVPDTLEERFMKSTENFDEAYKDSEEFLSEWKNITDSLEEVHRKCTIGSLSGSVIGAAGGITAIVGAVLAPFTLGASLIVTGVGIGVSVAGGITGTDETRLFIL
ncbi:serine threonine- kinase Nek4-like protein [Labeo rohita]|uniref:non-specific serine/threonine protein kinase n=1 Tax=Labeo rohita TaxID=84645 RepID=A0A498MFB1_LABRO|nr:serine threonine- kinase Nek4-like protein [Labeo rohita]